MVVSVVTTGGREDLTLTTFNDDDEYVVRTSHLTAESVGSPSVRPPPVRPMERDGTISNEIGGRRRRVLPKG